MEKVDGDAPVVPALVAAAEILGHEIVVRQPIAEVVINAGAARHQMTPQRVLANVMKRVANVEALDILSCKARVPGIGRHAKARRPLLVVGHDPRFLRLR